MTIVNVGVSHRTAPIQVLDQLAVSAAQLPDVLARLSAVPTVDEVVVVSTCNRIEVYAGAYGPVPPVVRAAAGVLATAGGFAADDVLGMARVCVDAAAVEHLFELACGLDSMAVGEDQIVAQLKAAVRAAQEAGSSGPVVGGLFDAALRVSKRARTQTSISTAGISLVRAGLDLAAAELGGLPGRRAVVLGTGSTGRLAARLLCRAGVRQLLVSGRDDARAAAAAAVVDGRPLRAADLPAALADADLLVAATGSLVPVVRAEQVRTARARAGDRHLFVLDLGVPPDVDAAVGGLAGVTRVDVAGLGRHLAAQEQPDHVPGVRAIVADEVAAYLRRQNEAAAAPFIGELHARARQVAEAELLRLHGRLSDLTDEHREEMARAVHRILRTFLHPPTVRARQLAADPGGAVYLAALHELFGPQVGRATP